MNRTTSPTDIKAFFQSQNKYVLTFLGFSGAGYEHKDSLLKIAARILTHFDPESTIVNIGATPEGIGAIYPMAQEMGFLTTGIVSSQALEYAAPISPAVDHYFFVKDSRWGGKILETNQLSPTSSLMVDLSDEIIAIGGGEVARDELEAARLAGKKTHFFGLEQDHELAREKARSKGLPEPNDFRGAAEKAESQNH